MAVRPPEGREVSAEVQIEVAPNTVTEITNLRSARLRTWQGQQWEEQVVARLKLGGCRRPEPIDLGLHRGRRLASFDREAPATKLLFRSRSENAQPLLLKNWSKQAVALRMCPSYVSTWVRFLPALDHRIPTHYPPRCFPAFRLFRGLPVLLPRAVTS